MQYLFVELVVNIIGSLPMTDSLVIEFKQS